MLIYTLDLLKVHIPALLQLYRLDQVFAVTITHSENKTRCFLSMSLLH